MELINLPEGIAGFLEIAFPPIVMKPGASAMVFITFPVEIAMFLEVKKGEEHIRNSSG